MSKKIMLFLLSLAVGISLASCQTGDNDVDTTNDCWYMVYNEGSVDITSATLHWGSNYSLISTPLLPGHGIINREPVDSMTFSVTTQNSLATITAPSSGSVTIFKGDIYVINRGDTSQILDIDDASNWQDEINQIYGAPAKGSSAIFTTPSGKKIQLDFIDTKLPQNAK
jgi:hypothetical protein